MSCSLERTFVTRELAERAVEHLVQKLGVERTDIFVTPQGSQNSSGEAISGGDAPAVLEPGREDAALAGGITVSIDVNDNEREQVIRRALDAVSDA